MLDGQCTRGAGASCIWVQSNEEQREHVPVVDDVVELLHETEIRPVVARRQRVEVHNDVFLGQSHLLKEPKPQTRSTTVSMTLMR